MIITIVDIEKVLITRVWRDDSGVQVTKAALFIHRVMNKCPTNRGIEIFQALCVTHRGSFGAIDRFQHLEIVCGHILKMKSLSQG